MKKMMNAVKRMSGANWMRVAAITVTAVFVAVMCMMEQIRSLI
jgi:hypothetical protein